MRSGPQILFKQEQEQRKAMRINKETRSIKSIACFPVALISIKSECSRNISARINLQKGKLTALTPDINCQGINDCSISLPLIFLLSPHILRIHPL